MDVMDLYRDPEATATEYLPPSTASPVTNVIVTLRTRQAGDYQCTVSVYRTSAFSLTNAASATVSVTG